MSTLIPSGMTTKQARAYLDRANREWPEALAQVPKSRWIPCPWDEQNRIAVFRSRKFLVQIFQEAGGYIRLSVNRTELAKGGDRWEENIGWDELQKLKGEAGFSDYWAVEVFPPALDVVNVANMRHLWVLPSRPDFGWKRNGANTPAIARKGTKAAPEGANG